MRIRIKPGCCITTLKMEAEGEYDVSPMLGAALCEVGLAEPVRERRETATVGADSQAVEVRNGR